MYLYHGAKKSVIPEIMSVNKFGKKYKLEKNYCIYSNTLGFTVKVKYYFLQQGSS